MAASPELDLATMTVVFAYPDPITVANALMDQVPQPSSEHQPNPFPSKVQSEVASLPPHEVLVAALHETCAGFHKFGAASR